MTTAPTTTPPTTASAIPDAELAQRVQEALGRSPNAMTIAIAHNLGVTEDRVIASLPDGRAVELDAGRATELIERFEALGPVHVINSNGVVALEAFGSFGNFSTTGPYFNVQTKTLDMHIRHKGLARVFAVEKPSHMDGVPTQSFQFFKPDGHSAFKVFLSFGGKVASPEMIEQFNALRDAFRLR